MHGMSPVELWETMSWPVRLNTIFMGILSIYMLYVIVERFVVFSRGVKESYRYVLVLRDYLAKRKVDDALKAAKHHAASPVAKVVESGLQAYKQGREALENEGPEDVGDFDLGPSRRKLTNRTGRGVEASSGRVSSK
jgi:biopolymer transport protein ExbB